MKPKVGVTWRNMIFFQPFGSLVTEGNHWFSCRTLQTFFPDGDGKLVYLIFFSIFPIIYDIDTIYLILR